MNNEYYYSTVKKVLIIVLVLNISVALAKGVYGWRTNSLSMVSDGFHSLFDSTSNIIGLVAIMIAARPPDTVHPYGHGKFETFASLGIAILLFITGLEIAQSAIGRFFNPITPDITVISFLVMGVTLVINVAVSWYEKSEGTRLGSSILISDSLHTRSDIYTSIAVILGFIAIKFGYVMADPIIAIFIVILIVKMGIEIIRGSSDILLDKAPLDEENIKRIVMTVDKVKDGHKIRSRGTAPHIYVDLHITLELCYSLNEAHKIAHQVETELKNSVPGIEDVVVHVDPCKEEEDNI